MLGEDRGLQSHTAGMQGLLGLCAVLENPVAVVLLQSEGRGHGKDRNLRGGLLSVHCPKWLLKPNQFVEGCEDFLGLTLSFGTE